MADKETLLQSKTIYQGPIFEVEIQDVALANGVETKRDVVRHVPAISVLAFVDDDHVILEKQWRAAVSDFVIEIPAGKLDERDFDQPEHAVQRELNEELRLQAASIEQVMGYYEAIGFTDAYMYLYVARDLTPVYEELPQDLGESIDLLTVSFDEMSAMFADGRLNDQKTVTAFLYWAKLRLEAAK